MEGRVNNLDNHLRWGTVAVVVALFALALALSYGAARIGHPTAVWLWRDMLGVL